MKLTSQVKLYIAIAAAVVIVAALIALLIVPKISERGDLEAQIRDAEQQIQVNEALLKRRQETKQRAAATDTEILRLANEVPESPELPALIIELQDVVNESGLFFNRITPSDPGPGVDEDSDDDKAPDFWTVEIEMEVIGTWQDTVDFLQRLRRLTRQIRVERIDVVREDPKESQESTITVELPNEVRTTVIIEAYTIPNEAEAAAPAAPAPPSQ